MLTETLSVNSYFYVYSSVCHAEIDNDLFLCIIVIWHHI